MIIHISEGGLRLLQKYGSPSMCNNLLLIYQTDQQHSKYYFFQGRGNFNPCPVQVYECFALRPAV